jgi:hypothetical protein
MEEAGMEARIICVQVTGGTAELDNALRETLKLLDPEGTSQAALRGGFAVVADGVAVDGQKKTTDVASSTPAGSSSASPVPASGRGSSDAILSRLRRDGSADLKTIESWQLAPATTLNYHIRKLVQAGQVERIGRLYHPLNVPSATDSSTTTGAR